MKPYYEHAGVTIWNADCREILPRVGCVALSITDPPYGMNFQSNHRVVKHGRIVGDEAMDAMTISEIVAQTTHAAYIFCRWDNLRELPEPTSVLAWVKNNWSMGDLEHEHGRQWEAIAFYPKTCHAFIKRIPDVLYGDRTGNSFHPTQKPVSIIKSLIAANVGESVLDPYCGSGATLIALKELGRMAYGIEIDEAHCETAAKRLSQEVFHF